MPAPASDWINTKTEAKHMVLTPSLMSRLPSALVLTRDSRSLAPERRLHPQFSSVQVYSEQRQPRYFRSSTINRLSRSSIAIFLSPPKKFPFPTHFNREELNAVFGYGSGTARRLWTSLNVANAVNSRDYDGPKMNLFGRKANLARKCLGKRPLWYWCCSQGHNSLDGRTVF